MERGGGQGRRIGVISGTAGAIGAIKVALESPHRVVPGPRSDKGPVQKPSTYMWIILPPLWTPKCEYLWDGKGSVQGKNGLEIDEYNRTRNKKDERAGRETEAQHVEAIPIYVDT